MLSLPDINQAGVIEALNSTSRYLDDLHFLFRLDLVRNEWHTNVYSSKIYDKLDDFNFEILNFPYLDDDVPRSPSYGVYISQLIRFASGFS